MQKEWIILQNVADQWLWKVSTTEHVNTGTSLRNPWKKNAPENAVLKEWRISPIFMAREKTTHFH